MLSRPLLIFFICSYTHNREPLLSLTPPCRASKCKLTHLAGSDNGVYVDSSKFAIKPNGTGPALNSHQTSISETPDQDLAVASTNASMIPAGSSGTPTVVPQKTAPVQMTPATVSINAAKPAASVIPPETTESKSNGAGVAFAPRIVALAAASLLSAGIIVLF